MEIDFKTVRALSSPTRVRILHELLEKESTPTGLSKKTGKSKSTVSAHLSTLHESGLIDKDSKEGRKRVVYSPTDKAKAIVNGKERKVKFSIASSIISAFTGLTLAYEGVNRLNFLADDAMESVDMEAEMAADTAAETGFETGSMLFSGEIFLFIGFGLLTFSVLAFLYGYTVRKI